MIWSASITAFLCGCIAQDGTIGKPSDPSAKILIITTVDKTRVEEVMNVCRNHGILVTRNKGGRSPFSGKRGYQVYFSRKNGQWNSLLSSIIRHGMEEWLGSKKFNRLKSSPLT